MKIAVSGPFKGDYSLAVVNRCFSAALRNAGHAVLLQPTESIDELRNDEAFMMSAVATIPTLTAIGAVKHVDLVTHNNWPIPVPDSSVPAVMHCFAWEESILPFSLATRLSSYLMIGTTAAFVSRAFANSGVATKILTMGNGTDHIKVLDKHNAHSDQKKKPFTFLHVSSCFPRKGIRLLLDAYFSEFDQDDGVMLRIKTFDNPHNADLRSYIQQKMTEQTSPPGVELQAVALTEIDYFSLYLDADVLVAPSYGEGFLFPAAEAMLNDCAVITTNWGGQTDFCRDDTAWLIDYTLETAKSHVSAPGARWARPEQSHLQFLMREMLSLSAEERGLRTAVGKRLLQEQHKWSDVVQRFEKGLSSVYEIQPTESSPSFSRISGQEYQPRNHAVISTFNQRCGIATYTEELLSSSCSTDRVSLVISESVSKVEQLVPDYMKNWDVRRIWRRDTASVQDIVRCVQQSECSHVLIQHHPGIFGWDMLGTIISQLTSDVRVTAELHSVADGYSDFAGNARLISTANRVIVHGSKEYELAARYLTVSKLSLIPHGIGPLCETHLEPSNNGVFRICSFGFTAPHKGIHVCIEACAILRELGVTVQYTAYSALDMSNEGSRQYGKYCVELVKVLGLENCVSFVFDFLPLDAVITELSGFDAAVLAYDEVLEGASGAGRVLLRTGIPLIVTRVAIFDDLKEVCITVPPCNSHQIARELLKLARNETSRLDQISRQKAFVEAVQWDRVSAMILGMACDY